MRNETGHAKQETRARDPSALTYSNQVRTIEMGIFQQSHGAVVHFSPGGLLGLAGLSAEVLVWEPLTYAVRARLQRKCSRAGTIAEVWPLLSLAVSCYPARRTCLRLLRRRLLGRVSNDLRRRWRVCRPLRSHHSRGRRCWSRATAKAPPLRVRIANPIALLSGRARGCLSARMLSPAFAAPMLIQWSIL